MNTLPHNDFTVVAACADMIFAARIGAAVKAVGGRSVLLTGRTDLLAKARAEQPALLLLDLDARWLDAPPAISALKADAATALIPLVAFASHVRTDALAAARAAGADRVLARSAFVRVLPELLRSAGNSAGREGIGPP